MTAAAATSVSILWLWSDDGSPADRFDVLTRATSCECEALLIGSPQAQELLARLPQFFTRQSVVAPDARTFAVAVNRAVAVSAGAFIVVAPASAEPAPGWLETLLDMVDSAPRIDAVTSKLVSPSGALAAAGSILWRDGTCEPFGRGDVPTWHEHEFRRDVPAAPPVYLLLRRQALRDGGGFDEGFTSAEYAVADLCLRLREARRRIVYEPRTTIRTAQLTAASSVHAPEPTADRDRLAARHSAALTSFPSRPPVPTTRHRLAARDALCSDRMLIVDDRVPGADRGSGDPRMLRLVLEIAALWPDLRLTFAAQRALEPERYAPALRDAGVEVLFGCPDWTAWFIERRFHYGAVMVSKPQPIDTLVRRTQPQAFRIYDAEAFVFRRLERTLPFIEDPTRAREVASQLRGVRIAESEYLASADLIVCVSQEERRAARAIAERVPSFVIPHQVDVLDAPAGYGGRGGLIYFGGFMAGAGSPNEDALIHLVSDVLPLLHAQEPALVLYVVGADPTPTVRALESDRIRIIGYVPDPIVWLSRTRVHLAPMRFGSGVKLKLIDTMAAGLPFVTTPVGAEGLRLGSLRRIAVGDTAATLAALTLRLYRDEGLWTTTQQTLLGLARRHFGRDRFRQSLVTAMAHVGLTPAPPQSSSAP